MYFFFLKKHTFQKKELAPFGANLYPFGNNLLYKSASKLSPLYIYGGTAYCTAKCVKIASLIEGQLAVKSSTKIVSLLMCKGRGNLL